MLHLQVKGLPHKIILEVKKQYPEIEDVIRKAKNETLNYKGSLQPFQAAVLYQLAKQYNEYGYEILEIGGAVGFTTSVLAQACKKASITSLNPTNHERQQAILSLVEYNNVEILHYSSKQFLENTDKSYDLIFVDGDHKNIALDWPYYDRLNKDGLILFHDYSPFNSWSPCLPVYEFLNKKASEIGDFHVLVKDQFGVGMAGWYK